MLTAQSCLKKCLFSLLITSSLSLSPVSAQLNNYEGYKTITKPVVENKHSIITYLRSLDMDTAGCYYLKPGRYMESLRSISGMPVLLAFDARGRQIQLSDSRLGCADPSVQLARLGRQHSYPLDTQRQLAQVLSSIIPYQAAEYVDAGYDYTFVIYWAKFLGLADSNEKVARWEQNIRNNPNIRSRIIKINLEAQQSWTEAEQQVPMALLAKLYEHLMKVNQAGTE